MCIEVLLQRVCVGALKERLPAWWSSSANPQGRSLGARDSDAGPMLVEERAALLTQLFVRRIRLTDSGKEIHGALVRQEIQEPHKLPMQAAGGRRDQGQESLSVLQVVQAVQYDSAEWEPAFLRQAREFLFFPLLPREASKSVPIFDRGTGSKPERLRSGFLQADLSLIV